jgi:UDP-4-amino-4-deoxy-L-arabinose formyltransferase/UDP-glucuronic acid dehydrogenase (UDP-4-keto-hexauronic acid decarboxylating)
MADELDAGPILVQESIPIDERSYIGDVYDEIARRFPRMFAEAVDGLATGAIVARAQSDDPRDALRCHPRRPEDGHIDWSLPAEHIARLVRASAEPFAGAYTWYGSARLRIWRADTVSLSSPALGVPGQVTRIDRSTGTIGVCCGAGELLVSLVGRDDGDRVAAAQVVRSTRDRLGLDLEAEVAALHARIAHLESRLSREAD